MDDQLLKELKAYRALRGYTVKAGKKAIDELEESIKDPQNEAVKEHLKGRKKELEKALETLENIEA